MFLNVSNKNQGLQNKFLDYKIVCPNEIISEKVFPDVGLLPECQFRKIKKINFKDVNSVLLRRGHALGDVIMTFPIVNYLRKQGKTVSVLTSTKYTIPGIDFISDRVRTSPGEYDLIIDLDWVVEKDHYETKYFAVNRVDIYAEYMNLKRIGNDWTADFPEIDVDIEDAEIAIQLKGSTAAKSMNIRPLLDELEIRGIKYYVIDDIKEYAGVYKNAVVRPTNVVGLLNIFKKLKGVFTFDSGPLWLSHVTGTSAFCVVGPTSGKKITARHPNKHTTYYDTKIDYGCKCAPCGCGEGTVECGGGFSCMKNVDHNRLKTKFFEWIEGL
jgi:hypothetical protein